MPSTAPRWPTVSPTSRQAPGGGDGGRVRGWPSHSPRHLEGRAARDPAVTRCRPTGHRVRRRTEQRPVQPGLPLQHRGPPLPGGGAGAASPRRRLPLAQRQHRLGARDARDTAAPTDLPGAMRSPGGRHPAPATASGAAVHPRGLPPRPAASCKRFLGQRRSPSNAWPAASLRGRGKSAPPGFDMRSPLGQTDPGGRGTHATLEPPLQIKHAVRELSCLLVLEVHSLVLGRAARPGSVGCPPASVFSPRPNSVTPGSCLHEDLPCHRGFGLGDGASCQAGSWEHVCSITNQY